MTYLTLGRIIKAKGLKGTVKVASSTDFAEERYQKGTSLFLYNEKTKETLPVTVSDYYFDQDFDYVTFEEYPDIDAITPFIGYSVVADRDSLPALEEGEYYFCDLEGCSVYDKDILIGKVTKVEDFAGRRSLRIARKGKQDLLLPFLGVFIKEVDIEKKTIQAELIEGMND